MHEEPLAKCMELDEAVSSSHSWQKFWHQGEERGNTRKIREIYLGCDGDALLLKLD